jgi:hypothetical protein
MYVFYKKSGIQNSMVEVLTVDCQSSNLIIHCLSLNDNRQSSGFTNRP